MNQDSATNKAPRKSAQSATDNGKTSKGFTDEERAAMKELARELKKDRRALEESGELI